MRFPLSLSRSLFAPAVCSPRVRVRLVLVLRVTASRPPKCRRCRRTLYYFYTIFLELFFMADAASAADRDADESRHSTPS